MLIHSYNTVSEIINNEKFTLKTSLATMHLFNTIYYTFLTFFRFSHCRNSFQSLIKNFLFYKSPFIMYFIWYFYDKIYISSDSVSRFVKRARDWLVVVHKQKKFWAYELGFLIVCTIYSSINFLLLLSRYNYLNE